MMKLKVEDFVKVCGKNTSLSLLHIFLEFLPEMAEHFPEHAEDIERIYLELRKVENEELNSFRDWAKENGDKE